MPCLLTTPKKGQRRVHIQMQKRANSGGITSYRKLNCTTLFGQIIQSSATASFRESSVPTAALFTTLCLAHSLIGTFCSQCENASQSDSDAVLPYHNREVC
ncbi:unnamed protein product [Alopecurus aequalis]